MDTSTGHLIGYARVSTDDQEAQLQHDALTDAECARIFTDKASGKNTDRPELGAVLDYVRPGDTLCVWKLDRFARSLIDLVNMVDALAARGVGFRVLTGALASIDPNTPDGRLMLQVVGAMAEFERSLIKDRTRAGLDAARAQGRTGGRPVVMDADKLAAAKARRAKGESATAVAKALGVSRATLYRALKESKSPVGNGSSRPGGEAE
ncbi:recombinase family protein [Streptomyces sp. NBC_00441]|uniref:recombinase family protein n=1 Tax=Streptomyces sp. NBC_00441 TaxID=2975742 RepID=UPI002E28F6C5|nr:recombinase family protein [Streptomyces sp. NBC_00441]